MSNCRSKIIVLIRIKHELIFIIGFAIIPVREIKQLKSMRKTFSILILLALIFGGCNNKNKSDTNSKAVIEILIQKQSNLLVEAAINLDMDSILRFYDKKVSAIEQGHMHSNSEEFISTYKTALESVSEVHRIEVINHRINVLNEQVVIYEAKLKQDLTLKNGDRIEAMNVLTLVFNLISNEWKIVHHHGSFPIQE